MPSVKLAVYPPPRPICANSSNRPLSSSFTVTYSGPYPVRIFWVRPWITSGLGLGRVIAGGAAASAFAAFPFSVSATPTFRTWSSRLPSRYTVIPLHFSSYARRYAFFTSSTVASGGRFIVLWLTKPFATNVLFDGTWKSCTSSCPYVVPSTRAYTNGWWTSSLSLFHGGWSAKSDVTSRNHRRLSRDGSRPVRARFGTLHSCSLNLRDLRTRAFSRAKDSRSTTLTGTPWYVSRGRWRRPRAARCFLSSANPIVPTNSFLQSDTIASS